MWRVATAMSAVASSGYFLVILGDILLLVFRMCQTYGHYGLDEFRKEVHPHGSTPL